jgi:ABC-2 type transport system permease protein
MKQVSIETLQLNKEGKTSKSNGMTSFYKSFVMAFLLTMPILLYGMDMARSVVEEKTSRIFEVMLAIARPDDLLAGKLLGVGAVGLTQIAIWVAAAALVTGSALAATLLTGDFAIHFSLAEALLFPVYFLLGFFLYSAFFSGLAATCETAQELQMYMPLAAVPVWLSFGILPLILGDPNSKWAIAASLFPPTAPFVMLPRMGIEMPPIWQFAASIGLMILSIWAVLWLSSRIYRVGILMYGKRATLPELLRWLRYS